MEIYLDAFLKGFNGTLNYTWKSICFEVNWYNNYFWGLIAISLMVWLLEILFPWRKDQSVLRKDFWLDAFYMFFNFFVFAIIIQGVYNMLEVSFGQLGITIQSIAFFNIQDWPLWSQLVVFFVLLDFVQWLTN